MRIFILLLFISFLYLPCFSQSYNSDSALNSLKFKKDSTLRALKSLSDSSYHTTMRNDSVRINKEYTEKEKWEKLKGIAVYPAIKSGGEMSGVIPVKDLTEIPDPAIDYKLLFELVRNNPDSLAKDINGGLAEIARVINLHVASGVPLKKIMPVIVVHAAALKAISNNGYYKKNFKIENPNLKLIQELKNMGAKFIACGQAMTFFDVNKEDLLPEVKVSVTAQTVISSYQLKGYVLFWP